MKKTIVMVANEVTNKKGNEDRKFDTIYTAFP